MVMAQAARQLLDAGQDIHVLVVGKGEDQTRIAELLGDRVTMPGNVSQTELAAFYASSDVFLFPSTTEVCPNVVIEAKASGLPVLVAASHGGAQFIRRPGIDGLIAADQRPETWAALTEKLLDDGAARRAMSAAARDWAENEWPSWTDVLTGDLLNAWHSAADAVKSATITGRHPVLATRNAKIGWSENGLQ
jgi:glycosyltransferase involved in cell wall biosynthesis